MRRAYGERINLLKTTLESTEVSIRSVRENLAMMLTQASETELAGRKVPKTAPRRSASCTPKASSSSRSRSIVAPSWRR
jgi:hypothetical protein